MDCKHNTLIRQEDELPNLYSCPECGEMLTADVYEIVVQKGVPKNV